MMLNHVYGTAAVIIAFFLIQVVTRTFDPFAPVWLFLIGYIQVYIIQAISYHEWALNVRGAEVIAAANFRALWALIWFLLVYHLGLGRLIAPRLPQPPKQWSATTVALIAPPLILWGLFCAGMVLRSGPSTASDASAEETLFRSFPFVMLVAANLLIVTGRHGGPARRPTFWLGILVAAAYVFIWMFNGKRSHSLIGVLSMVCAIYITKQKRPSWPVMMATALAGCLVVGVAIGWRNFKEKGDQPTFSGFIQFVSDFRLATVLENLNFESDEDSPPLGSRNYRSKETEEYGGFLLMMDTVPDKSDFDYGANYLRIVSTFIPRIVWQSKPLFGREQWASAWVAGSEMKRTMEFTGPAIGILGATQLNGGALGAAVVMACLATLLRTSYEYFRHHAIVPWVQAWWALTYYNSWFMVVCDDPMIWFYYNWGFTTMPTLVLLWISNKLAPSTSAHVVTEA